MSWRLGDRVVEWGNVKQWATWRADKPHSAQEVLTSADEQIPANFSMFQWVKCVANCIQKLDACTATLLPICPPDSLVASQAKGLLKWHAFRWQGPQGSSRSHYVLLILQWIKYRRLNHESGYCTCREFEFLHVLKLQHASRTLEP